MSNAVAQREFLLKTGEIVTVSICAPVRLDNGDYKCICESTGFSGLIVPEARGVDSLQALIIAIELLRKALKPYGAEISSSGIKGSGIPLIPLGAYLIDQEFSGETERLVEAQVERRSLEFIERKKGTPQKL